MATRQAILGMRLDMISPTTHHAKLSFRLFWSLTTVDCVLALIFGTHPSTGGDAAGNGMAQGFAFLLMLAAFVALALLAVIFAFVRAASIRYVLGGLALALGLSLALAVS